VVNWKSFHHGKAISSCTKDTEHFVFRDENVFILQTFEAFETKQKHQMMGQYLILFKWSRLTKTPHSSLIQCI